MRPGLLTIIGALIVSWCCSPTAAAENRWWWPFNGNRSEESDMTGNSLSPPAGTTSVSGAPMETAPHSSAAAESHRWMPESPLNKVSRPKIHLPEISLPKPRLPRAPWWSSKPPATDARNAWAQPAQQPTKPSPLQTVKQGAQRVGNGTRAAWHKTIDVITPGDSNPSSPQVAMRDERPSLWTRMFGQAEPPPPGPRTVTEWMAQDRLDP